VDLLIKKSDIFIWLATGFASAHFDVLRQ